MPHANSTTSSPRCTSPSASESTLPCSSVITEAISVARALTISRKANSTFVRLLIEVCDQSGNASRAAAMAASTSLTSASSTSACCSPVAGLKTGAVRSEVPVVALPAIQCSMVLNEISSATLSLHTDFITESVRAGRLRSGVEARLVDELDLDPVAAVERLHARVADGLRGVAVPRARPAQPCPRDDLVDPLLELHVVGGDEPLAPVLGHP